MQLAARQQVDRFAWNLVVGSVRKCVYPLQLWLIFGDSRGRFTWRLNRLSSWHQLLRNSLRIWVKYILEQTSERGMAYTFYSQYTFCVTVRDIATKREWTYRTYCTARAFPIFFGCVKYRHRQFQIRFSVCKYYVYVDKNHLGWAYLICLECYCETRRSANMSLTIACWRART